MKVLNYGSLNVDYVYSVDHIIVGGLPSWRFSVGERD